MSEQVTYDFEWDAAKALSNARKRGVTFDQAATIFIDAFAITVFDEQHSEKENRWFTLGFDANGTLLAVAHTFEEIFPRAPSGADYFRAGSNQTRTAILRGRTSIGDSMNAKTNFPQDDEDMPAEINFAGGVRGKFYRPNLKLNLPVYLDAEVHAYLAKIAAKKGVPVSDVANDLLKREIAIIEAVK